MRLTPEQQKLIIQAVHETISPKAQIWVFGSRAQHNSLGGDIDLYIECEPLENSALSKIRLKLRLEDLLGEQKIDILLHQANTQMLPIHEVARQNGVLLAPTT